MTNFWEFLLQTGTATLVALLILVLKEILADKLSPRWQYGVWMVFALRCLIPVDAGKNVLLPLGWWLETLKGTVEEQLSSAYAAWYEPLDLETILPMVTGKPVSFTDWLFVIYAAGVAVFALWYLAGYVRLRWILKKGTPASDALERQICVLTGKYGVPACPVVEVEGLRSAFVCGVFRPILAVHAGEPVDDKVLLHELLHLKHQDALQNFFWCGLRCLHWCNPVMHWVFDRIGNDMESLCDQRVLERLEGEERRDYGRILLAMANDRYPRAPGTSSISNGGKNIARRIEAIVRFRKYPRGMGLVSVCMIVLLLSPTLTGSAVEYGNSLSNYVDTAWMDSAMACARLNRCRTPISAVDCYARGLLRENGIYIAMVSPYEDHGAIAAEMQRNRDDGWYPNRYYAGDEISTLDSPEYEAFDLVEQPDGSYTGYLAFYIMGVMDENQGTVFLVDENGEYTYGYAVIPIRVYESDGWVVEETGERMVFAEADWDALRQSDELIQRRCASVETAVGTLTISCRDFYCYGSHGQTGYFTDAALTGTPDPELELDGLRTCFEAELECSGAPEEKLKLEIYHESGIEDGYVFPDPAGGSGGSGGGDSMGYVFETGYADDWDGGIQIQWQTDAYPGTVAKFGQAQTFRYRITRDGEVVEEGAVTVK